ncbi:uncharacterized protein LOC125670006 [Ostrea edulis]|uniref:uncharacterized protein LOC125670006 n=1 Tax=Ostrea edulis TaxID=37623 RepID=UPI0024AED50F|nr:uncharacterized protein LOC125670006 [Ostrea edulis]
MEKLAPCPGTEEMYSMAVEMGILSMTIIVCTALPAVLKATKSSITSFIFILKKGLSQMKEFIQYRKNTANDVSEEKRPRHINYYVFRNAYKQRKLVMLMRQEDLDEEILLYNPNTRTVKRIA